MSDETRDGMESSNPEEAPEAEAGPPPAPGPSEAAPPPAPDGPAAAPPPPPPETDSGAAPPPPPSGGGGSTGASGGGAVNENRTLWLVLSYLGPLAFAPFLMEQEDEEVQWHAKNGILFFAVDIVLWFVSGAVLSVPFLNCIGCLPVVAISLGQLGLHIFAIVKALNGERLRIPSLSDFADRPWG